MLILATLLTLTPWNGPLPPAAGADAVQYRLTVRGRANDRVQLEAAGLPKGWIASFCTGEICAPFRYAIRLDKKGEGAIEFQAVRVDDAAPRRVRITVRTNDGASIERTVAARSR